MKSAIIRYTAIVAKGGWRQLPDVKLEQGSNHPGVAILRERLILSGELEAGAAGGFDSDSKAVGSNQASNGLAPTGIVDRARGRPDSVCLASQAAQLISTAAGTQDAEQNICHIPAAQIEAVKRAIVSRHAGVRGQDRRHTPI